MSQYIISIKQCAEYMQTQTRGLSTAVDQNPSRLFLGCLLSLTLFSIFSRKMPLKNMTKKNSIGDGAITDLRFADDINAVAGVEQALEALDKSIDRICSRYAMEISAEKTKPTTNIASGIQRKNKAEGQKLGIQASSIASIMSMFEVRSKQTCENVICYLMKMSEKSQILVYKDFLNRFCVFKQIHWPCNCLK